MRRLSTFKSAFSTAVLRLFVRGTNLISARCSGQGLVEYGLILVLIMVVCVAVLTLTGKKLSELWYDKIIAAF